MERSPYCDTWDGLEGLLIKFVDAAFVGLGAEVVVARPPIVSIDSALSSLSGPSSGPESSSKIVFLFAGGGRAASEGGFLVILRPYDNVDMETVKNDKVESLWAIDKSVVNLICACNGVELGVVWLRLLRDYIDITVL